ncbi:hypothetical protein SAMN05421630_110285 [Prauserella marina]|uniref:Uncharacterized protein n=1 Tax=Prauserella marina TaxID=530584 RepID=A0A1G6WDE5_9PSEU|nr:hypothetical protein DES30_108284 [Prauserella marina]SDD63277.1 hypothetical protein SAMN05421630_110285 [Prauserella marina]
MSTEIARVAVVGSGQLGASRPSCSVRQALSAVRRSTAGSQKCCMSGRGFYVHEGT